MKEKKNVGRYILIVFTTIVTLSIGVSYSYWVGHGISGEGAPINGKLSLHGADIIFIDDTEISEEGIMPGWSTTKRFSIENTSDVPFVFDIYIKDFINTLVTDKYFKYKISCINDELYNIKKHITLTKNENKSDYDLLKSISIPAKTKREYTIEFVYENDFKNDQSVDMGLGFSGRLMIKENKNPSLFTTLTNGQNYPDVKTRTDFDTVLDNEKGTTGVIYKEITYKEEGKPVYYFAGNVEDNWVKFANKYWRIIRTNEEGSIRLLYAGTTPDTTSAYIATDIKYGEDCRNTIAVGWMYGTTGSLDNNRGVNSTGEYNTNLNSAPIKTTVENWYASNILTNYGKYVEENAVYCNDRSSDGWGSDYYSPMYYAAADRIFNNSLSGRQPSYKCGENTTGNYMDTSRTWKTKEKGMFDDASNADKFSVSSEFGGNGKLTYPIALITADEIAFAGGSFVYGNSKAYYFLNSVGESIVGTKKWWTMTPYNFSGSGDSSAYVFAIDGKFNYESDYGKLSADYTCNTGGNMRVVRPVLSLKQDVIVKSGTGTAEDPYVVGD